MTKVGGTQLRLAGLEALELRLALEAVRAERAVAEQTLAEAAHDLRAGLASIIGYAEILQTAAADVVTTRQIPRRVSRLAMALSDIVSELGTSAQLNSRSRLRKCFSVRTLLETCAQEIEPRCREKSLALRVNLPTGGRFVGDPTTIRRILHNLLTNAVRYTERGQIRLSGSLDQRGALLLEVRDTGIGIPPEDQTQIFEAHCRLEAARRLEPLGTGLGLSVVQRCCDLLGGRVSVESTPGAGSVFRVWLPSARRLAKSKVEQGLLFTMALPKQSTRPSIRRVRRPRLLEISALSSQE